MWSKSVDIMVFTMDLLWQSNRETIVGCHQDISCQGSTAVPYSLWG